MTNRTNSMISTDDLNKTRHKPLVTFIIAVYNAADTLEETLQSVINQTYEQIELIVIDGASTDGSVEIIKKYEDKIDFWVSEKDHGISDAFNKGIKLAKGDYINFQGAGDIMESNTVINDIFGKENAELPVLIAGRIRRVDEANEKTLWISPMPANLKFNHRSLLWRMSLYHQGLFTHQSFFKEYGPFGKDYKFSMDYEHLLRAYHHFPKVKLVDMIVSKWRAGGVGSNKDRDIFREYDLIKRQNKIEPGIVLSLVNFWILFKYTIKKFIN